MRRLVGLALAVSLGFMVGCSDDDSSGFVADTSPATDEGSDEGSAAGAMDPPEIDPAAMPEPGTVELEVDGSTLRYAEADAAASAYHCSVDGDDITVEMQVSSQTVTIRWNEALDGVMRGQITASAAGSDRTYFSTLEVDGALAVDGTMAVYEGTFYYRTRSDPGLQEDAGPGVLRVTC